MTYFVIASEPLNCGKLKQKFTRSILARYTWQFITRLYTKKENKTVVNFTRNIHQNNHSFLSIHILIWILNKELTIIRLVMRL